MKRKLALLLLILTGFFAAAASAEAATNQTNSVVRFRISNGLVLFGQIDVELFDLDKPITVTNFLRHVQRGDYNKSILHDLRPGFTVSGGYGTVPSPNSSSPFVALSRIPQADPITNEFHSGTLRNNVFGTLAMAKETTDPDSATSRWFFNLGDNSDGIGTDNLNTHLDGYTVFGQVKTGSAVLQTLSSFSLNSGIVNMFEPAYQHFCPEPQLYPGGQFIAFDSLPVKLNEPAVASCLRYTNLLNVQVTMLSGPDVLAPNGLITFPKAQATLTNDFLTVRGTASDNLAVSSVRVFLNDLPHIVATGPTNWSTWEAGLTNIPPGTNILAVEFIDSTGNISRLEQSFFRSVRVPLLLTIDGEGTVKGAINNQLLELTRFYTLTAKPSAGHLFDSWIGSVNTNTPSLQFEMKSNTALTAVFATNLFPYVKGTYSGLFLNEDDFAQASSGFVTLTLGPFGTYTGKLLLNGKTHPFKGTFSPNGTETNLVLRRGTNNLLLQLSLDLTNGTDQLTGVVTNNQGGSFIDTNRSWWAELTADRLVFDARLNPAPQAGKYTAIFPANPDATGGPAGDGFGTVTVTTKGGVALAGTLADGTKASQKASLSKDGAWPLYVPLYKDKGALVSWLHFTNDTTSETDISGPLTWFKQTQTSARFYPEGFTNDLLVAGSRYTAPTTGRVIDLTTGTVGFTNLVLFDDFANAVELDEQNKVTTLSSNKLTLTISKSSGLFSGSVTPPDETRSIPFKGALLQRQNRGSGFFFSTNQSGRVAIGP